MRILIHLRSLGTFPYELAYHHDFQGFIYGLLRGTNYHFLHDKARYKFFCFSNLVPPTRVISQDSLKTLMVSSPDDAFIRTLQEKLMAHQDASVRLGNMRFKMTGAESVRLVLSPSAAEETALTSGTPIVVRIPSYRLEEYGIQPKRNYEFVYWRSEHTPTSFIKQLEENLWKKYCEYFSAKEQPNLTLFEKLKFRKQVAVPLKMKGSESTVIGTLWEFHFGPIDERKRRLLEFGLDVGFGEMNSLGFGFMNVQESKTDIKSH